MGTGTSQPVLSGVSSLFDPLQEKRGKTVTAVVCVLRVCVSRPSGCSVEYREIMVVFFEVPLELS